MRVDFGKNSNFNTKRRIQNLLFPQGILYNRKKDNYRTLKINLLFSAIPYLASISSENKKRDFDFLTEIPAWVGKKSNISNLLKDDIEKISNFKLSKKNEKIR